MMTRRLRNNHFKTTRAYCIRCGTLFSALPETGVGYGCPGVDCHGVLKFVWKAGTLKTFTTVEMLTDLECLLTLNAY